MPEISAYSALAGPDALDVVPVTDVSDTTSSANGTTKKLTLANLTGIRTQNQQAAGYTLALTDAGKIVEISNGSANNLTVPANATVAFAVGTVVDIVQTGAGQTTIVAAGGVTVNKAAATLKLTAQYSVARLYKQATNTWIASGDLAAS